MSKKRILFADDEAGIRDFVSRGLADFGYEVTLAEDGAETWSHLTISPFHDCTIGRPGQGNGGIVKSSNRQLFDLVILDIRMPGMSGIEVCQRLRAEQGYATPVLMLTALSTTDDIVMGLHAGADDYIVKPFKFMELLARIEALLRRVEANEEIANRKLSNSKLSNSKWTYADLRLDPVSHKVVRGGVGDGASPVTVELSTKEFRLLEYMVAHAGEVLSRRQLLKDVWDKNFDTNTNVVDVYVRYLRSKIDEPFEQKLIHTVVGKGYAFGIENSNSPTRKLTR